MENKLNVASLMSDQMKAVVAKQVELAGDAFDTNVGFEEMRDNYVKERAFWNEGGPVMAKTVDQVMEGPAGEFKVRYYYPVEADVLPVIEFIHGGGFVVGNLETHDRACRLLAHLTGAAVVAVDYQLSPESKYPTNILECVHVANYLHEHGAEHGIDGNDLSFAGDSGGAVLSMAANLWLRDKCGDNSFVKTLLLWYGFYGLMDSCSMRLFGTIEDGMRREDMDYYMSCYLDDLSELERSPYLNMLSADLATSMPATFLASAELDPLKDDSTTLHHILKNNGVPCEHVEYPGVLHAFIHYTKMLDEANACIEHSAMFWKAHHTA